MKTTKTDRAAMDRGVEISRACSKAFARWERGTGDHRTLHFREALELELGRAGFRIVREPAGRTAARCDECASFRHAPDCSKRWAT